MNIKEIRKQYPQYGDMSDQEVADGLHTKFYADMPRPEFYAKVGLAESPPEPAEPSPTFNGKNVNSPGCNLIFIPVDASTSPNNIKSFPTLAAVVPFDASTPVCFIYT